MRAARLYPGEKFLRLEDVPVPKPGPGEILLRVAGAGVCHSDLHLLDGLDAQALQCLPVTLGHEISGWVHEMGDGVDGIKVGDAALVLCVWGCSLCDWCLAGHHELCRSGRIAGATVDGGFAQFVIVPHQNRLVPLEELDPVHAAPLGDAALTPYRAIERVRHLLTGSSTLVVIGIGGLGEYAVQLGKIMTSARVVAVDRREDRLQRAQELGADQTVHSTQGAIDTIIRAAGEDRVLAVLDFVGSDESLELATGVIGRRGIVVLIGMAGGSMPLEFHSMAPEAMFTTLLSGGTATYLRDIVDLYRAKRIGGEVTTFPLDQVNDVLQMLRSGKISGRAVITPSCEADSLG